MRPHSATRRTALSGLAATLLAPAASAQTLSAQDKALVDTAVAYLQGLTHVRGRFEQTDERGRLSRGDFFLQRPGKVRFAYDSPTDLLVVSNGSVIGLHNKRLKTFEQGPLSASPLSIFLAKEIRLDRGVVVTQVRRFADGFSITARDGKKETAGQIVLVFGGTPLALREWTTINPQGGRIRVVLTSLNRVASLDPALFVVRDPRVRPGTARPN